MEHFVSVSTRIPFVPLQTGDALSGILINCPSETTDT